MRILHVITRRQLRGAEIFASQLSAEFVRQGHEVMIVALRSAGEFITVPGVTYIDLDLKPFQRWWSYGAWKKFAGLVRTWNPDVIQANASETLKFTVISRLLFGRRPPLVYRNANKVSDFITSRLSLAINRMLARSVDFVISVSENCRVDFVQTFDLPPGKTITITIGTIVPDPSAMASLPEADAVVPHWINVGTLVPEKNHTRLLHLYKNYRERGGYAELWIVGGGPAQGALESLAVSLGIADSVHFLGYRKDVQALMASAEGLLLPSLIEGLPGVILEAMATNIPVIAYAVGGIPEVVYHRETGMLIGKGEEQQFVNAMHEVEADLDLRRRIVQNAFSLCQRQYRIETIALRFLAQYEKMVSVYRTPAR